LPDAKGAGTPALQKKEHTMAFAHRGLATLVGLALLTPSLAAQRLSVSPGSVLKAGDTATITYTNASMAGQSVTVTVTGGFPAVTVEVLMQLNERGEGTGTWVVNGKWMSAHFNAPGVHEVTIPIE
jgi:hypothetical protein